MVLFRGQNRDFFDDDNCLSILPAAFRPKVNSPFGRITNRKEIETNRKTIKMIPLNASPINHEYQDAIDLADWPSLHVYFQKEDDNEYPIIDLRNLSCFNSIYNRPFAQEGFVLPFKRCINTQPQEAVWTHEINSKRMTLFIKNLKKNIYQ
jgi:hypothetical protein